eukprot:616063-Prymnesium_polylepis.1
MAEDAAADVLQVVGWDVVGWGGRARGGRRVEVQGAPLDELAEDGGVGQAGTVRREEGADLPY